MRLGPARLLLPDGTLIPGHLEVDGGRIASVEPGAANPNGIIAPGFIDLQVNGRAGIDVAGATVDDLSALDAMHLATGVTGWCPTLVSAPLDAYAGPLAAIDEACTRHSTILGAHLEGPFLGGAPGAHHVEHIVDPDLDWIAALPAAVRMMTVAPEAAQAGAAIALLRRRGVTVSLGHSTATFSQTVAAVEAGATLVTHLFNGMGPLHQREPGMLGAALADDRLAACVIADGCHVAPALVRLAFRAKGTGRVILVSDAVAWTGDGLPRLDDGTIAGSTLTLDAAVRNAIEFGVPPSDALVAATAAPADALRLRDRGRLALGARADVCLLDDDLDPKSVWVAGRLAWER